MVINISKDASGRIIVFFSYDPQLVAKAKTVENRKWHKDKKYWSFPESDSTLEKILKTFKDEEIRLDPALKGTVSHCKPRIKFGAKQSLHNFEDLRRELIEGIYDCALRGTVPDLRTNYPCPPHRWGREREGVKKLESGLSLKLLKLSHQKEA